MSKLLDQSPDLFFPAEFAKKYSAFNQFPMSKWNFVVIDAPKDAKDRQAVHELCSKLKYAAFQKETSQGDCLPGLDHLSLSIQDWVDDLPLRRTQPSQAETDGAMNQTLVKASMPLPKPALEILRHDPYGESAVLREKIIGRQLFDLQLDQGLLVTADHSKVVIPISLNHPQLDIEKTLPVLEAIQQTCESQGRCDQVGMAGGHFASLENQNQVKEDLQSVSIFVGLIFLVVGAWFVIKKKKHLTLVAIPVLLGMFGGVLVTVGVYGSIHGLVLAFGCAIIGVSLDYALHAGFHGHSKKIWRSNTVGMVTTTGVLAILSTTTLPLLRQLMVFSISGIFLSFCMTYLGTRVGKVAKFSPLIKPPNPSRWQGLGAFLVVAGLGSVFLSGKGIEVDLSLERFNFATPQTAKTTQWLKEQTNHSSPIFKIHWDSDFARYLDQAQGELAQAQELGVRIENAALYLPPLQEQKNNLESWKKDPCHENLADYTPTQKGFFAPYLRDQCETLSQISVGNVNRAYLNNIRSPNHWLSVWYPRSVDQRAAIMKEHPSAFSMSEFATNFSWELAEEMGQMLPLGFAFACGVLLIYYRRISLVLTSLIPLAGGIGFNLWIVYFSGVTINFVHFVSILMLSGISLDYGIFATDDARRRQRPTQNEPVSGGSETWSAIFLSACSTFIGIFPLVLCQHPVLRDLGAPLAFGIVGTFLATRYGIPYAVGILDSQHRVGGKHA
jgi:hypothetical protein